MRANILDAFFVEIGLDKTKFERPMKAAVSDMERGKASMQASAAILQDSIGKAVEDSFRRVQRQFLSFFAVLLGTRSIADFVENVTRAETQIGIMAGRHDRGVGHQPVGL